MKTKLFLITQRIILTEYGEERECLEVNWHRFINNFDNIHLLPISYHSNINSILKNMKIDGIIFSGGNDLSSIINCNINKKRDSFEIKLYKLALSLNIPILAICRGAQLIAEHYGATITKVYNHVNCQHDLIQSNFCIKIPLKVNSYHNYGITDLKNQTIIARDKEGNIECFKCPGALCCMWHPERDPINVNIFQQYFNINDCKAIVLCAGQGTRLRPLTNYVPKCMVKYKNVRLIDYIINTLTKKIKQENITLVTGYLNDKLQIKPFKQILSKNYASTNMLTSLFLALDTGPVIISYSDIIYHPDILKKLHNSTDDIAVVVDHDWLKLWSQRMDNPLDDVETLRFDSCNNIVEIGNKPTMLKEIEAQYIGLIKLSNKGIEIFKQVAEKIDISQMSITPFLQHVINEGHTVKPVHINGGWAEFDCPDDLLVNIDTTWYTPMFFFGTKACNMKNLSKMDKSIVMPMFFFNLSEWKNNTFDINPFLKNIIKLS